MAAAIRYTRLTVAAEGIGINFRITPLASPMRPLIATQIGKTRVPDIQDYRSLNWGNVMKIALYVAALCSMILFNSSVLADGSGVSSGPSAHLYRGPRSLSRDPSLHSPDQYASPSGPSARPYRDSRSVSCRLSLRSPGQYTSPSGPGAHLYRGPKSLLCDPSLIKNQVGQTKPVKPELPTFHRPFNAVPAPFQMGNPGGNPGQSSSR
jgi:hypothetical protein